MKMSGSAPGEDVRQYNSTITTVLRHLCTTVFSLQGHVVPSWKPRCFVLQNFPATLSYFDPAKKPAKTINTLSLRGASVFTVGKIAAETGKGG